ncbi:MAG: methyl-accepting chemotaxis protein [Tepidisphaerales bacterium]
MTTTNTLDAGSITAADVPEPDADALSASGDVSENSAGGALAVEPAAETPAHAAESPVSAGNAAAAEKLMSLAIDVSAMSGGMADLASRARQGADQAEKAADHADAGASSVREAMAAMDAVGHALDSTEQRMAAVLGSVDRIARFIETVSRVAKTTRLLALNAAIEAAHATDERSQAFKVVAQEVRSLADESSKVATSVQDELDNLRRLVDHTSGTLSNTREKVEAGGTSVNDVGLKIAALVEATRVIVSTSRDIATELDRLASTAEASSRQLNVVAVEVAGP